MEPQPFYVAGFGLGLVGGLATGAGLALAGSLATAVLALAATIPVALGLARAIGREEFDLESTLAHRVGRWGGAVVVVAVGLLLFGVGIAVLGTYGGLFPGTSG